MFSTIALLLALLASACEAQVTRITLGSVLPTSAAIQSALVDGLTQAKGRLPRLVAADVNITVASVGTGTPSADVRVLFADAADDAEALEATTGTLVVSFGSDSVTAVDKRTRPNLFRVLPSEADEGTVVADLVAQFGQAKVVAIYENSAFGVAALETFKTRARARQLNLLREVEVRSVWDSAALQQALTSVAALTLTAQNTSTDVGTIVYLGSSPTTFTNTVAAGSVLRISGSPFLWIATRAASLLPNATLARPEYRGLITVGAFQNELAYAADAIAVVAQALDTALTAAPNATTAVALPNLRAQLLTARAPRTPPVLFDPVTQDRRALFGVFNVQSGGALVRVGSFSSDVLLINANATLLFTTGENEPPTFPWVSCAAQISCYDCSSVQKCGWCPNSSKCFNGNTLAATCTVTPVRNNILCPAECVASSLPVQCLYNASITLWSQQKPRCDAINKPINGPSTFHDPAAAMTPCQVALYNERSCQQLIQRFACSSSCQQCLGANNTVNPLPVCKSVCDPLIFANCRNTVGNCTGDENPFQFNCVNDTLPCTRTVLQAAPLQNPVTTTSTTTTTTTTAPATTAAATTAPAPTTEAPTTAQETTAPTTAAETTAAETTTADGTTTAAATTTAPTTTTTTGTRAATTAAPTTTTAAAASTGATTSRKPGKVTLSAAEVAAALAEQQRKTRLLYQEENDLRLGIAIGIAAFLCALLLAATCAISRRN